MNEEMSNGNRLRVLSEIVTVDAWTEPGGDDRRAIFYVALAFQKSRIGGEEGTSEVRFTMAVKQCDIVIIPPQDPSIVVDKSTVHRPPPLAPLKQRQLQANRTKLGFRGTLKAAFGKRPETFVEAQGAFSRERETSLGSEQDISAYDEGWKITQDGYYAWSVNGGLLEDGLLNKSIWDGKQPRLHLIDERSDDVRAREKQRQMEPHARIEIRCAAEDIWIGDIEYKDPARQALFERSAHKAEKLVAARQFIMHELKSRSLEPGDMVKNTLAKLKIADVSLKIF